MNSIKLSSLVIAALVSVSAASAQIITNYGQATYPGSNWNGSWDGVTGQGLNNSLRWAAQTFIAPSESLIIYAYNVQLTNQSGNPVSFTTSIYEWAGTTLGAQVANTAATFTWDAATGYNAYGANVTTGAGVALNSNQIYALVVHRTDGNVESVGQFVQTGLDGENSYTGGSAYKSSNGTSFTPLFSGGADLAFWMSFSESSLSPVPEPAVSGTLIGAGFVGALLLRRRRKQKADAAVVIV